MDKKLKAIALRRSGESYSVICKSLNLSKSTLSDWVKHIPYSPNISTLNRIKNGPLKSAMIRHQARVSSTLGIRKLAAKKVGKINKNSIWMFGLGLYLGEGAKSIESVRITNSNADVVRFGVNWLKKIYGVKNKNLSLSVHTYPDNDISESIEYWSKVTGIPTTQFGKTQIDKRTDKRSKFRNKLPYGTADVRVLAKGNENFGVKLHRRIMAEIDAVII